MGFCHFLLELGRGVAAQITWAANIKIMLQGLRPVILISLDSLYIVVLIFMPYLYHSAFLLRELLHLKHEELPF